MIDTIISWFTSKGLQLGTSILSAVVIAVIGYLAIRLVMTIVQNVLAKSALEKAAHSLIITLAKTVLYVLLGLVLASSLGIDVTGIVALASVVTLAISLALQDMLSNIVGGFTLLYTHPFSSGDYVEIASQSGTVKEIGMTYTKLLTPDNKMISIPNKAVVSAEIVNYTVTGTRRLDINLAVSYSIPAENVLALLEKASDQPGVLTEPGKIIAIKEYNEQNITYGVMLWCNSADYWDLKFAINRELSRLATEAGITFYDPHLHVHMDK